MAALSAALLALTAANAVGGALSQRRQGEYEAGQLDQNAAYADRQAADVLARGKQDESALRQDTKQLIGAQRARLGASGVSLDSGSALDVQTDASGLGELDAMMLRNNARNRAYTFQSEAAQSRAAGEQTRTSSRNAARSTLLTGALQTYQMGSQMGAGSWLKRKPNQQAIGRDAAAFGAALVRGAY